MADIKLTDEIRAALESATIYGTSITLAGSLDRALYLKVNKFIEAAGGKWSRTGKYHQFQSDPASALGLVIAKGEVKDERKALQAFYTPDRLADRVIEIAGVAGHDVFEPSCGGGALVDAALRAGARFVWGMDIDPAAVMATMDRVTKIHGGGAANILHGDFIMMLPRQFIRVVMNPPFCKRQDIAHVTRAYEHFLAPGGRIVAIMSPSGAKAIRAKYPELTSGFPVAAGAFKESGTNAATEVVVLEKPAPATTTTTTTSIQRTRVCPPAITPPASGASPLLQQWYEYRKGITGKAVLGFRLGDFIEFFQEDATVAACTLSIPVTRRQGMLMAGIPHHSVMMYAEKLHVAGYAVFLADYDYASEESLPEQASKPTRVVRQYLPAI